MGRPLGSVAIRPGLEVGLEDRLQDELERTLDHAVADARNRKDTNFCAPVLGYLHVPCRPRVVTALEPVRSESARETPPRRFPRWPRTSPRQCPGHRRSPWPTVGFAQRLHLADVNVQPPETPGRFSLRLDVYPPSQVLQIDGRLCHLALASLRVRGVTNSRAPSLHGHYSASSLLRTHPPPSRRRPTSRLRRLYDLPSFRQFLDGTRRASPVA